MNTQTIESYFVRRNQPDEKLFPQFLELGEDIIMHVLSFVADAPFEDQKNLGIRNYMASMTHSLPLVSKQFHRLMQHDNYWREALVRQMKREPRLWKRGLQAVDPDKSIPAILAQPNTSQVYRQVLNHHVRFTGPIFAMGLSVELGKIYGLHLFEHRYRLLIAEVMSPYPASARQGGAIPLVQGKAPLFVHAYTHPVSRGTPAVIVSVQQCLVHDDGCADVLLMPVQHVRTEFLWERPNSGHLYAGQFIPLGEEESESIDRMASSPRIFGRPH